MKAKRIMGEWVRELGHLGEVAAVDGTDYDISLVSTKKSQEFFEVVEIQFVMSDL